MANDIATYTIGSDLRSDTDYLFEGQSVVAVGASPVTSGIVLAGKTEDQLEIVGKVATAVTVLDTEVVTFELEYADDAAFSVNTGSVTVYSLVSSGGDTLAVDDELFRYVPNIVQGTYWRVKLTSTLVTASGSVDVFPILVG